MVEDLAAVSTPAGLNAPDPASAPTWSSFAEAAQVVALPANLRKTILIALLVGTVLFAINQLDVVLSGRAAGSLWMKVGLTYLVPFCVSNYGILVATHRRRA